MRVCVCVRVCVYVCRFVYSVVRKRDRASVLAWLMIATAEQRQVFKRVGCKLLKSKYSNSRVQHTFEALIHQVG